MRSPRTFRGAALVVALVLLLIISLLATTGMVMSTSEMVMAGNEQFHRRAADAASAGVEAAIARLAARTVTSAAIRATGETVAGSYLATARHAGEESNLPGFSAEKFNGQHFEIESTGRSARDAIEEQLQGVMILVPRSSVDTFARIGKGLAGEGGES